MSSKKNSSTYRAKFGQAQQKTRRIQYVLLETAVPTLGKGHIACDYDKERGGIGKPTPTWSGDASSPVLVPKNKSRFRCKT